MGTKNKPGKFDCYTKLEPDEPYFVLRAKDPAAPHLVNAWAVAQMQQALNTQHEISTEKFLKMMEKSREAMRCANQMDCWREEYLKRTADPA